VYGYSHAFGHSHFVLFVVLVCDQCGRVASVHDGLSKFGGIVLILRR